MKILLMMSLTGGALALVVMGLRAVLGKKLHPRLIYLLWLPVVLTLLIPLRLESPVSLRNAPTVRYVEQSVSAYMEAPLRFVPQEEQAAEAVGTDTAIAIGTAPDGATEVEIKESIRENNAVKAEYDAWDVVGWVWAVGALLTGAAIALINVRFRARVRRSRKVLDVPWVIARQIGKTRVYVSKVVPSPCLLGVFAPCIVVTPQAVEDDARLVHVLTHERMHKAQGDHLWALVRMVALVLHWYNPIVWVAASLSRSDCENACDALTIRALGEENRVEYGKTLLAFLRAKPTATALVNAATTMAQSRRQIRRRISLIAKKQRYAWFAAALAVLITLTGCALTMTAPRTDDSSDVQDEETLLSQPSDETEVSAAVPIATDNALANSPAIRDYVLMFENALQPYVKAFEDMDEAQMHEIVPEFAEYEMYGRKNADGDAYILVKLPQLQKESAYQEVWASAWQGEQNEYVVERNGTLEGGGLVRLESYELEGLMIADTIQGIKDVLVLICEGSDPVLADLHTLSGIRTELFIRSAYPGASSIKPEQGSYLAIPMLNSATMQATGWSTAITAYLPVEENLIENLEFEHLEQKDLKEFWANTEYMSMMRLYLNEKTSVYIGADCLVMYEDYTPTGVYRDRNIYYKRFGGIIEETFGIDPFHYIHCKSFTAPENAQVTAASLIMLDHQTGEVLSASTTDGKSLEKLRKLVFEPDDILVGGAGCPFGGILTLQTTEGEFTFHVATDSCGVLCYEGNVYLDYGDQTELFEIFPACDPNSGVNFTADESTAALKTLEVLPAGASAWDIFDADAQVQELFEVIINKMESGESEPAQEIMEIVYELDFRDSDTARLMKVEVSPGLFTVNDRTYPDKKREVMTLIDSLYD